MDGIILIDKEKGMTSHDVVYKVKKITGEKVGHTGTLDPNATGVLPILVGKGTLCSKYLIEHDKIYEATIQLGKKTDTADIEGKIIEEKNVDNSIWNEEHLKKTLNSFVGKQSQIPPIYSAIKVNGKKLYEYARSGQNVELKPRQIEIYDCNLISYNENKMEIVFKVYCSKGTYIRSLCEDIAQKLNTVGYMKELKRDKVGIFDINSSIKVEEIENETKLKESLISIEDLFKNKQAIVIDNNRLVHFINGVKITYDLPDGIYKIYNEQNKFIGIGLLKNNLLKRDIII